MKRCLYCAFYSTEGASAGQIEEYPRLILRELGLRSWDWRGFRLGSIYFGGGTPSLLAPSAYEALLEAFLSELPSLPNIEITLEANPGTLIPESVAAYRRIGINRLSLGIQALDDHRLRFLGRIHSSNQAIETLGWAKEAGFQTLSVDLMAGTPLDSMGGWDKEFDQLFGFQPDGVSFYSLTVEEGTRLAQLMQSGEEVFLPYDETVDLLLHASDRLKGEGYRHYEVSNWALPGKECRHNLHYWRRGSYLGLGPSAHSFDGKTRSWNAPDLKAYTEAIEASKLPPSGAEIPDDEETRTEWIYLRLRQDGGLDLNQYQKLFGEVPPCWEKMFENIAGKALGVFDGRCFKPNDKGLLLADEIAARILG